MSSAALASLPKETLVAKLANIKNKAAKFEETHKTAMRRVVGHMSAGAGGIAGAIAKKYLPDLIPGEAADDVGLLGLALLVDVGAIAMGDSHEAEAANYFAAGFGGYIAGSMVEKILP